MNVINISKIVSLSDLKDLSIQEVGRGSCTIGKYEFTFEHVEFNHTVRHPDGNSLAPSCHFRTLLFSEGCTGDIRSGDSKEIFRASEEQAKFENVEVTAQPRLRQAPVVWLDIWSHSMLPPCQAKCPHTMTVFWARLLFLLLYKYLACGQALERDNFRIF